MFISGTVQAKVKSVFNTKRVTILGSLLAAFFNLWILVKFLIGRASFTPFELLVAITLSVIIVLWTNRLISVFRTPVHQQLEATREYLGEARVKLEESQKQTAELSRIVEEEASKRAEVQRELVEAQLSLRERIERQERPRWAYIGKLAGFLKGKPKGTVEIIYAPEDKEAQALAMGLEMELSAGAGWRISRQFRPFSADDSSQILPRYSTPAMKSLYLPLLTRVGGTDKGLSMIISPEDAYEALPKEGTAVHALLFGLIGCGFEVYEEIDDRLPHDNVRIVVGPK